MGTDNAYIYGDNNGQSYTAIEGEPERSVHWDPRVEVRGFEGMAVQIGVVPPSDRSSDDAGIWDPQDGQFLQLDWSGCNRLIVAIREQRDRVFGKAE